MATVNKNSAPIALKRLFDEQLQKAVELNGGKKSEITALYPLLKEIKFDKSINFGDEDDDKRSPFFIIVQNPKLDLSTRMNKVMVREKDGGWSVGSSRGVDESRLGNIYNIPQRHYLAVDVEYGLQMSDKSYRDCMKKFRRTHRLGGTAVEGATVAMYKTTNTKQSLFGFVLRLPGSLYVYDQSVYIPNLGYGVNCLPELQLVGSKLSEDYPARCLGALSCKERLSLNQS